MQLGPRLEYVKRWPPESWHLAFFETLHLIPQRDFRLLEGEMKRVLRNVGRDTGSDAEVPVEALDSELEDGVEAVT